MTKVRVDTYYVQNDARSIEIGQLNENIDGPTTNVRWSPRKTRTSCLMIIGRYTRHFTTSVLSELQYKHLNATAIPGFLNTRVW